MFEALVGGGIGVVAAVLGWIVARAAGPSGTPRHRVTLLASFVSLFTLGSAALMPHVRAWKQERDVLALLQSDPLFSAVLAEEPGLREPLRAALLGAVRGGGSGEAVAGGLRLLSTRLWRSVPDASDATAVVLGNALVARLSDLQARDPGQCYRFLFPGGGPAGGGSFRDEGILNALRLVGLSAREGNAEPLDRRAAGKQVAAAFGRLRERHGADVDVLRHPRSPGADRARVCAMTIALYRELLRLPPDAAGQALRHTLGPAEADAVGPERPAAGGPPAS